MTAAPPITGAFHGPLFVVGMPRSGTKLLRDLLNQHPRIGIPRVETEFLPYWFENWSSWGDLADRDRFQSFYNNVSLSSYFRYQTKEDALISAQRWFEQCAQFTPQGVFEALLRHDGGAAATSNVIWGDKSPSYLRHLRMLSERFPEARFVHIVRDVRDYCLSIRNAWGKNMLRAAQRWTDDVADALQAESELGERVLLVRYEDLLNDTQGALERICAHLELDFDPAMILLGETAENLGDTAGATEVVSSNQSKYLDALSSKEILAIEVIAAETLRRLDYPVSYGGETKRLSAAQQQAYKLSDAFQLVWSDVKRGEFWARIGLRWRQSREVR